MLATYVVRNTWIEGSGISRNRFGELHDVSVSPSGSWLAIAHNQTLTVHRLGTGGARQLELDVTSSRGVVACGFDKEGRLWLATPVGNSDTLRVQVRSANDWQLLDEVRVEDELSESLCSFQFLPEPSNVGFYLGAGQGGQRLFRLRLSNRLKALPIQELNDRSEPVFAPNHRELLVSSVMDGLMERYRYPSLKKVGEWEWSGTADDAPGCFHTYVSQDRALVESGNGCLFSFDVPTMDLIEELSLDLPVRKSVHMRSAGRNLVGVACRERRQSPMDWKDTLVIFDTPRLEGNSQNRQPSSTERLSLCHLSAGRPRTVSSGPRRPRPPQQVPGRAGTARHRRRRPASSSVVQTRPSSRAIAA